MSPPPAVLFVCTANQCRSPLAASLFAKALAERGRTARVGSAGIALPGRPVPPTGLAVARGFGLDLRGHRSTRLLPDMLDQADLVVAMAREHAREVILRVPERWPRTFTLLQLTRWLETHPAPADTVLGAWLDETAGGRPRSTVLGSSPDDDVPDPVGRPAPVWRSVAGLLSGQVEAVADLLAPALPVAGSDAFLQSRAPTER